MSTTEQQFVEDERPIASFFTSVYDIHFDAPLKSVADAVYGISQASELYFYNNTTTTSDDDQNEQKKNTKQHKLKIVPAKLQTFKEKSFQASGRKFGFVEFHIRSAEPATTKETNNNIKLDEIIASFHSPENKQKNLDFVHSQIDSVFSALSQAANLGMKLKRVPPLALQHLQQSPIVTGAIDPLKVLCFLSMRIEFSPTSPSSPTSTSQSTSASSISDREVFYFINNTPLSDMMLMREEHPTKFPSPATSDSVEKFLVDMLGGNEEKKFVLAKKELVEKQ